MSEQAPVAGQAIGDGKLAAGLGSWRIRIFALTWFTYASYYFCRQPFYIVKSDLERHFGIDAAFLGHIGLTYLVCYMLGQFTSAAMGRRLGSRLLLLFGMCATIGINVIFGLSNHAWTILLFMGLNGLAQGTGWSGVIGTMAYWFRRTERGQVMGLWATCYQVGAIAAKSYAALLLGIWGWRYSFFGGALITLLVWIANAFFLRSRPEDAGFPPLEEDDEPAPAAGAAAAAAAGGRA
ncbi:MAG: MFS transporter, partial [Deltaproteobacteria bacterium]|nr:MFS transporter [Deltaproteobacteria bacterium]